MNLHQIAGNALSGINPWITATIRKSSGYTTADDGSRTPTSASAPVQVKVQALTGKELAMVNGLNIQGEKRAIYAQGNYGGMVRADGTGGEEITLPDGTKWLNICTLENWYLTSGWVKMAVARQQ